MVGIKNMEMPCECWSCELTHNNTSGLTICNLTGEVLYPMEAINTRLAECPLVEFKNIQE